ncbi:hypothetical protein MC885_002232 [Smutsia gigantea]|nr:hypothetical protein MC885_002232 [Smutsia gigantea]
MEESLVGRAFYDFCPSNWGVLTLNIWFGLYVGFLPALAHGQLQPVGKEHKDRVFGPREPMRDTGGKCLEVSGKERRMGEKLESQEVDEELVAEVVETCPSETCSRPSENAASQKAIGSYSVKEFREETEYDTSKISVVRPFSVETKISTDIPAALGSKAADGRVTAVAGEALSSGTTGSAQDTAMTEGAMGAALEASTEADLKAGNSCLEPVPSRSKLRKPKPISLRKRTVGEFSEMETPLEGTPLTQASRPFGPDEVDGSTESPSLGGGRIQKSPPDGKETPNAPGSDTSGPGVELLEEAGSSPLKLEFDFTEDVENVESRKGLPRKLGRKLGTRLTPKAQKDGVSKPGGARGAEQPPEPASGQAPLAQVSSLLDPGQREDPTSGPFGGHSILQNSPPLSSKGTYHFEGSMAPFKPTTTLTSSDFCSPVGNHVNEILESPKKAKSRLIT